MHFAAVLMAEAVCRYKNIGRTMGDSMRKRVQLLFIAAVFVALLAGCGRASDTYVNQKDSTQTLELTTDKGVPLREVAHGVFNSPQGEFILNRDGKLASGRYSKVDDGYVLKLDGSKEWKMKVQPDSSLRDEDGNIWQHQSHSRQLRAGGLKSLLARN
jgi:hypothetical protein